MSARMGGVSMQGACGKWSWQGTTPQCEGLDRARATDMWWALARAEEEMERAHNTESETWHECMHGGVRMQGACGKWSWQGTTPQCEGLDRARATDMWWALARAEEEMERAHNTESETWH